MVIPDQEELSHGRQVRGRGHNPFFAIQRMATSPELGSEEADVRPGPSGLQQPRFEVEEAKPSTSVVAIPAPRTTCMGSKQGTSGTRKEFVANYFKLSYKSKLPLQQFSVTFEPELDSYMHRNAILGPFLESHEGELGPYLFDGGSMFFKLGHEIPAEFMTINVNDNRQPPRQFVVTLKLVKTVQPGDPKWIQIYNVILKRSMYAMGFVRIGKNFFDVKNSNEFPGVSVVAIPGFITSVRQHDAGVLLNVESTTKVMRGYTVLEQIAERMSSEKDERIARVKLEEEIVGSVVMTAYNTRTYTIEDILWDESPADTFPTDNGPMGYVEYYKKTYAMTIKSLIQPLLLVALRPKGKDAPKAQEQEQEENVGTAGRAKLVPEFCQLVGLSPAMRQNFRLMQELAAVLHPTPAQKLTAIMGFRQRLDEVEKVRNLWSSWHIEIGSELLRLPGRVYPNNQKVEFANTKAVTPSEDKADWNNAFRTEKLLRAVDVPEWTIIFPSRSAQDVGKFIEVLRRVAGNMGMTMGNPLQKSIDVARAPHYMKAVQEVTNERENHLVFVVLPQNNTDIYGMVKKKLTVDLGIPSQCFVARNLASKGVTSIATKVAVQINSKLGGESWSIKVPLPDTLIIGHARQKHKAGGYILTMVAGISRTSARYFNTASHMKSTDDFDAMIANDMNRCILAFAEANSGQLPNRIVFMMEGYSEAYFPLIQKETVRHVDAMFQKVYEGASCGKPKLSVMVVNRSPGIRVFGKQGSTVCNPKPGTIFDDAITLPQWTDFYLIPQSVRQGTVSPTTCVVLHDEQDIGIDKLQLLTFKFCHAYFNCFSTIAVPAVCQYAARLASQLVAVGSTDFNESLAYNLFYL